MKKQSKQYLQDLNIEQRQAVETTEGPVLVLAGAGSGKTRVLTYRIAHILHEKKASPWEILSMTFTNKAAGEMKERIQKLVGVEKDLWVGTFHSIFAKLLRWEADSVGYTSDYVIYDTDDQERVIKSIMEMERISAKDFYPKSISSAISRLKNQLIDPDAYEKTVQNKFEEIVARIYPSYCLRLRSSNAFDFDDLITVPIDLFSKHPDILEKYQTRFKYILVDEYQDTNRAQYALLKYLSQTHNNLCVVGDDDQSIYRWRGADIRNILEFEKDYQNTKTFRLEQNYRSTKTILRAAHSVVKNNVGRKEKELWSEQDEGEKVDVLELVDERAEAQKVADTIREEVFERKRTFHEFAVLYRTNAQSRVLEDALRRSGMSYIIVGGVRFYERKEIKDVLAYLKLISNPRDSVGLKRIINFPLRGIGDTTLRKIEEWSIKQNVSLFDAINRINDIPGISAGIKKKVVDFALLIQKYRDLKTKISLTELVHTLIDETLLFKMYKQDTTPEGQGRAENVREFLTAVDEYAESSDDASLSGFLEQVSLITDVDSWNDRSNAITLMTLHCAKGLEFPVVFITGLEEGLFPVARSLEEPEAVEEERRLLYVGMTRAKEKIYLLHAQKRSLYSDSTFRLPSRFLDELDPEVVRKSGPPRISFTTRRLGVRSRGEEIFDAHPDYESFSQEDQMLKKGVWINHEVFGKGKITLVEGAGVKQKITVQFDGGVKKKLLVQYAHFTIL